MNRVGDQVAAALREYLQAFPAFRAKPIGAPFSDERERQEEAIAREDRARAALQRHMREG